jgi:galactokinase
VPSARFDSAFDASEELSMLLEKRLVVTEYTRRRGRPPKWVVRAPGRVNLIGEHTDYNDGFVLPLAINRAIWIALEPRNDNQVVVYSVDFDQTLTVDLDKVTRGDPGWKEYIKAVTWSLQEAGFHLKGWEGVLQGDVPLAAGLSSSAALEMATARAFAVASDLPWDPIAMARLGQRAENGWVGVNCGIMDQLISAIGRAGHAVLIDCRTLEGQPVPFPRGTAVVVLDTGTRRGLVESAYNERRAQCEAAARYFGVKALRDVSLARFNDKAPAMDDLIRRRARHVIGENQRTLDAVEAMRRSEAVVLGRLMNQSHASLCDDYEVSSEALNTMVELALARSGCYGARMTGAGFGGCAVALVDAQIAESFAEAVTGKYRAQTGYIPSGYVCQATNGAEAFDIP